MPVGMRWWADKRAYSSWKGETLLFPSSAPGYILHLDILYSFLSPQTPSRGNSTILIQLHKVAEKEPSKRGVPARWYRASSQSLEGAELAGGMRDHSYGKGRHQTHPPGRSKASQPLTCAQPQPLVIFLNNPGSHKQWFKALSSNSAKQESEKLEIPAPDQQWGAHSCIEAATKGRGMIKPLPGVTQPLQLLLLEIWLGCTEMVWKGSAQVRAGWICLCVWKQHFRAYRNVLARIFLRNWITNLDVQETTFKGPFFLFLAFQSLFSFISCCPEAAWIIPYCSVIPYLVN